MKHTAVSYTAVISSNANREKIISWQNKLHYQTGASLQSVISSRLTIFYV